MESVGHLVLSKNAGVAYTEDLLTKRLSIVIPHDEEIGAVFAFHALVCISLAGGGLIDFDDVSAAVDGFWGGCRGLSLICRLCRMSDIQSHY